MNKTTCIHCGEKMEHVLSSNIRGVCDECGKWTLGKKFKDLMNLPKQAGTPINIHTVTGKKYDQDKTRMDLLMVGCAKSLRAVADVLSFGAKKYGDNNWRKVDNAKTRYTAALHRHLNAYYQGSKKDEESQLDHLAHALCCLLFLYEFELDE